MIACKFNVLRPRSFNMSQWRVVSRSKSTVALFSSTRASPSWSYGLAVLSNESNIINSHDALSYSSMTSSQHEETAATFLLKNNKKIDQSFFSQTLSSLLFLIKNKKNLNSLPRTLKDAMKNDYDNNNKAIVVTTIAYPHKIVHVNHAWEKMCGYQKNDILHQPIGSLLKGPKTNLSLARGMTRKILNLASSSSSSSSPSIQTSSCTLFSQSQKQQQEEDAYLVNYKASGEPFINHITAGVLYLNENDDNVNNSEQPQFLVGILEEVSPDQVPLRMMAIE